MIQELSHLATSRWHVMEVRAIKAGIWGVPGAPVRLLDLDSTVFLAFVEGIVRESDESATDLDAMYADARPAPPTPKQSREERIAAIQRFARLTQGETAS